MVDLQQASRNFRLVAAAARLLLPSQVVVQCVAAGHYAGKETRELLSPLKNQYDMRRGSVLDIVGVAGSIPAAPTIEAPRETLGLRHLWALSRKSVSKEPVPCPAGRRRRVPSYLVLSLIHRRISTTAVLGPG